MISIKWFLILFAGVSFQVYADGGFGQLLEVLSRKSVAAPGRAYTLADGLTDIKGTKAFAPLFVRYTLVRESFSIQESSPVQPRAILFGNTGKLIVTFNGGAHLQGGYALETAEYDESQKRILFREVIFKSELPEDARKNLEEIEFENEQIAITKPNPNKCMQCHEMPGQPGWARYIWSGYPVWPRMYGEQDDELDDREYKNFAKFKAAKNDRYDLLFSDGPLYPYIYRAKKQLSSRPNLLLTKYIAVYQAAQIANLVLSVASEQERAAIKKAYFDGIPAFPTTVLKIMGRLRLYPDEVMVAPSDDGIGHSFSVGTPSLFGGYNFDSMIEQQVFKQIYGDEVFQKLIETLPYHPSDSTYYPKYPKSYFSDLDSEALQFFNSNIFFKSIWWNIEPKLRQKALK